MRRMMESFRSPGPAGPHSRPPPSNFHSFFKKLISKTAESQLLRIELSVLGAIILLFLLFFLGSIRRCVRLTWLKYTIKMIYLVIPIFITYIMGLMHNASTFHELFPVWACALIYAYGGVDTMTACDLSDNENTLIYFWRTLPLFFWAIWLGIVSNLQFTDLLSLSLVLLSIVALVNTYETLEAFYVAGNSKGLPALIEPTVRYMLDGREVPNVVGTNNPVSFKGYRYLVWDEPPNQNGQGRINRTIVTTQEILGLDSMSVLANGEGRRERLQDLCLSYAFFRLLLIKFADFPLDENSRERTSRFIQEALIPTDHDDQPRGERMFHIIEVALDFLFDFFYTKSFVQRKMFYDQAGLLIKVLRTSFVFVCLGGIVTFSLLSSGSTSTKLFSIQVYGHTLEVGVTRVVILIFVVLEFWQLIIMTCFSNWTIVRLLCSCLRTDVGRIQRSISEKWIVFTWTIKDCLISKRNCFRVFCKPWQRKLGQYSFIESYGKVPFFARKPIPLLFGKLVKLPRIGQKGDFNVDLSVQVKKAIVWSLVENELVLSPGTTTIQENINQISDAFTNEWGNSETDLARLILVWHIATSVCEFSYPLKGNTSEDNEAADNFLVASQLSKYCAYLVSFAPELLPGHPHSTQRVFDKAVEQASIRGSNIRERYEKVMLMGKQQGENDDIVTKGARLANSLIEEVMKSNRDKGWEILGKFWAELLLYLALKSDRVAAHGEHLAEGGEFITHLWALLIHAGIQRAPPDSL